MTDSVRLRPVEQGELPELTRLLWDPQAPGEFQAFGFRVAAAREVERRWQHDGLLGEPQSFLTVVDDERCAGWVTWRAFDRTPAIEIGIALFADHRGRGIGTAAQRQLASYLFSTTPVHRLQAGTEVDNLAERRALEHAGFHKEGVMRGLHFRAGAWRDSVIYGLLRDDQ